MVERPEHAPTSRTQMITGETGSDPRQPAIAFVTTEHFVLQGARAATIAFIRHLPVSRSLLRYRG